LKILLIHNDTIDGKKIDQIKSLLGKKEIFAETIQVKTFETESAQVIGRLSSMFDSSSIDGKEQIEAAKAVHAIIISSINKRWFDFLAGISCSRSLPFFVYGEEAIASIPAEFSSNFTSFASEKSLLDYLSTETRIFEQYEEAVGINKAREALFKMGIPVNEESFARCASEGSILEISFFLAAGFSPNTRNKAGVPVLNIAARNGNHEIFRFLILTDANINLQAEDRGTSALMDSVLAKRYELTKELIKAEADLDLKNNAGQTALLVAVGDGDEQIAEILLKAGADPDITDNMGMTARAYAKLFNNSAIMELFDTYAAPKSN